MQQKGLLVLIILSCATGTIKRTLAAGEPVKWSGFGTLTVKDIPPQRFYSARLKEYTTSKGTKRIVFVSLRGE
jgi:nucleoid DNA-binding protein